MRGGCFEFYKILKAAFPQAEPYYDEVDGHVYTLIDGKFYDIRGRRYLKDDETSPMMENTRLMKDAHRWIGRTKFRLARMITDE
jgi:hypothetical protein